MGSIWAALEFANKANASTCREAKRVADIDYVLEEKKKLCQPAIAVLIYQKTSS